MFAGEPVSSQPYHEAHGWVDVPIGRTSWVMKLSSTGLLGVDVVSSVIFLCVWEDPENHVCGCSGAFP